MNTYVLSILHVGCDREYKYIDNFKYNKIVFLFINFWLRINTIYDTYVIYIIKNNNMNKINQVYTK